MAKTLLLADDSVTIQKVVGITFANQDVDLVTVDNGDDALEKAREIRPDLILADVNMPGLGGYELCRAIRAEPGIGATPLLLLTGTFETFDESRALEVGASAHIAKPFEAQALVEQVHRLLAAPATPPAADASPPPDSAASEVFPTAAEDFSFDDLDFHSPAGGPASPEETQLLGGDPLSGPADPGPGPEPPVPAPVEELTRLDTSDPLYSDLSFVDPLHDGGDTRTEAVMEPAEAAGEETPGLEPGSTASTLPAEGFGETREPGEVSEILGDLLLTEEDLFPDSGPESSAPATAEESAPWPAESLPGAGEPSGGEDLFFEESLPEVAPGSFVEPAGPEAEPEAPRVVEPAGETIETAPGVPLPEDRMIEPAPLLVEPAGEIIEPAPEPTPPEDRAIEPAEEPAAAGLPALDERAIQESLEKLAWEAFGPLSEQIVREVVRKVEAIAWEVLPRLAESLIREEIERMKAHTPGPGEPSL